MTLCVKGLIMSILDIMGRLMLGIGFIGLVGVSYYLTKAILQNIFK
jgi:hypothetical protein